MSTRATWHRADHRVPELVVPASKSQGTIEDCLATVRAHLVHLEHVEVDAELAVTYNVEFAISRGISASRKDLKLARTFSTPMGTTIWCFLQHREGIDLFGRQAIAEIDGEGDIV